MTNHVYLCRLENYYILILDTLMLSSITCSNRKENKAILYIRKIDLRIISIIEIMIICLVSFALSLLIINLIFSIMNQNIFCNYFMFDSLSTIILIVATLGYDINNVSSCFN